MAAFLYFQQLHVTDDVVKMFLELFHRISVRAKTELEQAILNRVAGKMGILHRLSATALNFPDSVISGAVYPVVPRDKLESLVKVRALGAPTQTKVSNNHAGEIHTSLSENDRSSFRINYF